MKDFVECSLLAQQSAVLEADSPHSSQNRENSAPSTACENMSVAAAELLPGHVTDVSGGLHSADQAGLSAGCSSLRYQCTDYTILDEAPSEQALSLSQGDSILYLVPYPEPLQLALSRWSSNFASLRFDPSGQPQVVFLSVGPIQAARQSARAPPHSVSAGTSQAAARSPVEPPPWRAPAPWICLSGLLRLHGPQVWPGDPRLFDQATIILLLLP